MMSRELERRLAEATELAKQAYHEFVTLEHILYSLTNSPVMNEILVSCAVNVQTLKKDLQEAVENEGQQQKRKRLPCVSLLQKIKQKLPHHKLTHAKRV